jgi:hypothetical protein
MQGGFYLGDVFKKEKHFNLYYIFKEDKEKKQLPNGQLTILWKEILKKD